LQDILLTGKDDPGRFVYLVSRNCVEAAEGSVPSTKDSLLKCELRLVRRYPNMLASSELWSYVFLCSASLFLGMTLVLWIFTKAAERENRKHGGSSFTLEWIICWIPFMLSIACGALALSTMIS
jgi:hypothetical protein